MGATGGHGIIGRWRNRRRGVNHRAKADAERPVGFRPRTRQDQIMDWISPPHPILTVLTAGGLRRRPCRGTSSPRA